MKQFSLNRLSTHNYLSLLFNYLQLYTMKKIIILVLLCIAAWQFYKYQTVPVITNEDLNVLRASKPLKMSSEVTIPPIKDQR